MFFLHISALPIISKNALLFNMQLIILEFVFDKFKKHQKTSISVSGFSKLSLAKSHKASKLPKSKSLSISVFSPPNKFPKMRKQGIWNWSILICEYSFIFCITAALAILSWYSSGPSDKKLNVHMLSMIISSFLFHKYVETIVIISDILICICLCICMYEFGFVK